MKHLNRKISNLLEQACGALLHDEQLPEIPAIREIGTEAESALMALWDVDEPEDPCEVKGIIVKRTADIVGILKTTRNGLRAFRPRHVVVDVLRTEALLRVERFLALVPLYAEMW